VNPLLQRDGALATAPPPPRRFAGACVALLDARDPAAWQAVAGLAPVQRLVRSLELEGVSEIVLLSSVEREPSALGMRRPATRARIRRVAPGEPIPADLRRSPAPGGVLAVDATLLVDRRLLGALLCAERPAVVSPTPDRPAEPARVRLARLHARQLDLLGAPLARAHDLDALDPCGLPLHQEEMRGRMPILLLDVSTPTAAARAEAPLVQSTQKLVMDAPARWIDPLPENWLLRRLAPTRVTPDHVTLAAAAIGAVAAWLLWRGWLAAALPLMLGVGWLDGVDGKLARLRLEFSRLGASEALLDFAVENAWWIALTVHLAGRYGEAALAAGAALIGGNLADEIAYTAGHARLGRALDLLSPADRSFRLVAGRRNIYVWILCAFAIAGSAQAGLAACGVWALVTAAVHWARLAGRLRGVAVAGSPP